MLQASITRAFGSLTLNAHTQQRIKKFLERTTMLKSHWHNLGTLAKVTLLYVLQKYKIRMFGSSPKRDLRMGDLALRLNVAIGLAKMSTEDIEASRNNHTA
jgi:hypothetical protein